jgi:hypothetical protein
MNRVHSEQEYGVLVLEIFEDGLPPLFRVSFQDWTVLPLPEPFTITVQTTRPSGGTQLFHFADFEGTLFQSIESIPEPHDFMRQAGGQSVIDIPIGTCYQRGQPVCRHTHICPTTLHIRSAQLLLLRLRPPHRFRSSSCSPVRSRACLGIL